MKKREKMSGVTDNSQYSPTDLNILLYPDCFRFYGSGIDCYRCDVAENCLRASIRGD